MRELKRWCKQHKHNKKAKDSTCAILHVIIWSYLLQLSIQIPVCYVCYQKVLTNPFHSVDIKKFNIRFSVVINNFEVVAKGRLDV